MKTSTKWKTRPISPTCEVIAGAHPPMHPKGGERYNCGLATSYAYPAMGGGWMALCDKHAAKHHPHCVSIEKLITDGETFE